MNMKELLKGLIPPVVVSLCRHLLRNPVRQDSFLMGAVPILLPKDHALPQYRKRWRLYDEPLRHISDALRGLYKDFCAIDIGANVGDSAAVINAGGQTPVLCIEGDPVYYPYLEHNGKLLGSHVVIEKCFVGEEQKWVNPALLQRHSGTTSGLNALRTAAATGLPVSRLESIVARHPAFDQCQLIKIDTDGYDFDIILAHLRYLSKTKPVLFFEYLLDLTKQTSDKSLQCTHELERLGYSRFMVFDNFGHFLLSTNSSATFRELNLYLLSNATYGTAVYYLDVCAIPDQYRGVGDRVKQTITELVAYSSRRFTDSDESCQQLGFP